MSDIDDYDQHDSGLTIQDLIDQSYREIEIDGEMKDVLCLGSLDRRVSGCYYQDDPVDNVELIKQIIKRETAEGIDIDRQNEDGCPNIYWGACLVGFDRMRLFHFYLEMGSDLNKMIKVSRISKKKLLSIGALLLDDMSCWEFKSKYGETIQLQYLLKYGFNITPDLDVDKELKAMQFFLNHGFTVDQQSLSILNNDQRISSNPKINKIRDYLKCAYELPSLLNSADNLHKLCQQGYGYLVDRYLNECSLNNIKTLLNQTDKDGNNCLQISLYSLAPKYLIKMILLGADYTHRNNKGQCFIDQLKEILNNDHYYDDIFKEYDKIDYEASKKYHGDVKEYYQRVINLIDNLNKLKMLSYYELPNDIIQLITFYLG